MARLGKKQDVRPYTTVTFDAFQCPALMDTGSEVTVLDFQSFCRLKKKPPLRPSPFRIRSASDDVIPVRGIADLEVVIQGRRILRPFCIIDSPRRRCIVGADAITENELNVLKKRKSAVPIRLQEAIVLEPCSERVVPVKIACDVGEGVATTCVNQSLFADGLITVKNGSSKLLLQNPREIPVNLTRNEEIGKFRSMPAGMVVSEKKMENLQTKLPYENPKKKMELLKEVDLSRVPLEYTRLYKALICKHAGAFSINPNDIGQCRKVTQSIRLKDANKVACVPPYRTPYHLRPVVEEYVQKLLATGVIQKSTSPFSSPLMLVRKANATPKQPLVEQYRVVHDYRQLNANTVRDSYPLHNLYDLIDRVSQAKVWSVIDLSSGFWNQELDKTSRGYTAFGVPGMGHFEYTRSAQGLCNSPPAFQRLLDYLTKDIDNVYVYVDDVVVCSATHDDHLQLLDRLFDRFKSFNLKCRIKKVQLGTTDINYLGYNLSKAKGIRPGLAKTEAVRNWKEPGTVKEVKQFLGLCSFFRRTIKNFASTASSLTRLTRKDCQWNGGPLEAPAKAAFHALKESLSSRPCLTPVNFTREFILTVDASTVGLGAILSQVDKNNIERPCAYASRTLNDAEKKKAPFYLEHLAMVWACKHFKPYLAGRHFTLRTDHKPLTSLNRTQGVGLERLQMELQEFQPFTVKYLPGEKMPADGLSRLTEGISVSLNINNNQLRDLQQQDVQAKAAVCRLKFGGLPRRHPLRDFVLEHEKQFCLKEGVLGSTFRGEFVPYAPRSIRENVLRLAHDDLTAGHASFDKTTKRIKPLWYWPHMDSDIQIYCRSCHVCNTTNLPAHKRPVPLEPLNSVSVFNERVHMDLLGPLPTHRGSKYLLVVIDAFSKLMEVVALPSKEMEVVADAFFNEWICRHGIPTTLNSDQGKEFTNQMFKKLACRFEIDQVFSSVSHPQSNGQAERQIRTTIAFLRKYLEGTNDWTDWLPAIRFSHNTNVHSSNSYTPFMAAYTRLPKFPLSLGKPHTYSDNEIDQKLALAAKIQGDIVKSQQQAYESRRVQFDKRAREKEIQVGDVVYLIRSRRGQQFQKFQPLYEGPYRISKTGNNNNVFIVPLDQGQHRIRKAFWIHINNLKLAPFARQYTIEPDTDVPAPHDTKKNSPQYSPKPGPKLLPFPDEGDLELVFPLVQNEQNIPNTHDKEDESTQDVSQPTNDTAAAAAVAAPAPEASIPTAPLPDPPIANAPKASPVKRALRSLVEKTGVRLPDSIVSSYPADHAPRARKKKETAAAAPAGQGRQGASQSSRRPPEKESARATTGDRRPPTASSSSSSASRVQKRVEQGGKKK